MFSRIYSIRSISGGIFHSFKIKHQVCQVENRRCLSAVIKIPGSVQQIQQLYSLNKKCDFSNTLQGTMKHILHVGKRIIIDSKSALSKGYGQISIIPKPECFGDFGEVPLFSPPFRVTTRRETSL